MSDPGKAVFLSYASQDAEAAKNICDALRAAGVEVWFDQSELRGGDSWDAKIRKQIKECALFVPVITPNTNARAEGYFRREWKQAVERTHDMADDVPFLFPVVIGDVTDATARVPDKFRDVQWTRLRLDETPAELAKRVTRLLTNEPGAGSVERRAEDRQTKREKRPTWLRYSWAAVGILFGLVYAVRPLIQPSRRAEPQPAAIAPALAPAGSAELARVRAQLTPDRWQREDFAAMSPTLDRLIEANPESSDAWAMRSIINSLQVLRNFDSSTKPLEVGKAAADRALRLAPGSPLADIATGMHLVAMTSRGGDARACRPYLDRGVAALPPDALTRYAELASYWFAYDFDQVERCAQGWLDTEPRASFPPWIFAQLNVVRRRPGEAEKWAELAATDPNITGVRALNTMFESKYYLRADLTTAWATLQRVPSVGRSVHRVVHARWLVAVAGHRWDDALQELAQVPETFLFDRSYHGPKALLAGLAHRAAGRADAAAAQFREAERLLKEHLGSDSDNEELHTVLAVTLACAGHVAEARSELALVEPLVKGRSPTIYRGSLVLTIAQAYAELGDPGRLAFWLRKLLAEPSQFPFTPASIRVDPRFAGTVDAPEIQALLKEFAPLDQPIAAAALPKVDDKSVAVLAFANLSDDKANEYFSDGISEELLNVLAKIPGLKVSARTSAFYFKGKEVPIPEIAKQLGVAYVIEGSVRKQGDKVRITAQLIKAADGFHVWSDTFTRDLKDIFAVQDEIAGLIAQQLQLKLGESSPAMKQVNPEAYRLVLEGRHFLAPRTSVGFDQAERAFTAALKIDPQFALAQAGLATTTALRGRYRLLDGIGRVEEFDQLALTQCRLALQMDPALAEPHATIGFIYTDTGRQEEAEQEFRLAIAANPNFATAYHWHSHVLASEGQLDLALQEIGRAEALDPVSFIILFIRGFYLTDARRFTEALAVLDRAAAIRGESFLPLEGERARVLLALGRTEEALAVARKVLQDPRLYTSSWQAAGEALYVLRLGGAAAEAERLAPAILQGMPGGSYRRGYVLCALGNFTAGLREFEHIPSIMQSRLYWHPMLEPIHDTPEFKQLLVKLNGVQEFKVARATLARMLKESQQK